MAALDVNFATMHAGDRNHGARGSNVQLAPKIISGTKLDYVSQPTLTTLFSEFGNERCFKLD